MDQIKIFESLLLLNERIEGLLARVDYFSYNVQPQLKPLMTLSDNKRKNVLKDVKLMTEYFPVSKRESVKTSLKPVVETLYQVELMIVTIIITVLM